jgi:hypothetical protein
MSSSKKRKNDTISQTPDDPHPQESSLRQTVHIVQSSKRFNMYEPEEHETHAVYSTLHAANEAARCIFNTLGSNYGPVSEASLAAAHASWLRTGESGWPVEHDGSEDDDDDDDRWPKEVEFGVNGAVSIELGMDVGEREELRVWVRTFGIDSGTY